MENSDQIKYIGFNQDASCISLSVEKDLGRQNEASFRIYSVSPLRTCFTRVFPGSFSIVEILYKSNIIALVGGGKNSRYPSTKLILWDDLLLMPIGELKFHSDIKSVKLNKLHIYVVLESKIYVFYLKNLRLSEIIDTFHNPRGACSLCLEENKEVFAYPGERRGDAIVKFYSENKERLIQAHETSLACICLNKDGSLLATSSDKGTLVRIFTTDSKELIQELRRGIDRAQIYSLAFHSSSHWIACSSNTGTVHIYSIDSEVKNRKLGLRFFKKIIPKYFESEWSYAHFKVKDARTICAFVGDELKVAVVSDDGMFYEINFAARGNCVCEKTVRLLEIDN